MHRKSTEQPRAAFAQQAHAEAHALLALRGAFRRMARMRTIEEALKDLEQDMAYRAGRLGRAPDAICDELESAKLEFVASMARMAGCAEVMP